LGEEWKRNYRKEVALSLNALGVTNLTRLQKKVLKESREEEGETFESLDDFWTSMEMKPNAED